MEWMENKVVKMPYIERKLVYFKYVWIVKQAFLGEKFCKSFSFVVVWALHGSIFIMLFILRVYFVSSLNARNKMKICRECFSKYIFILWFIVYHIQTAYYINFNNIPIWYKFITVIIKFFFYFIFYKFERQLRKWNVISFFLILAFIFFSFLFFFMRKY